MLSGTVEGARAPKRCVLLECQEIEKFAIALTMLDRSLADPQEKAGVASCPFVFWEMLLGILC